MRFGLSSWCFPAGPEGQQHSLKRVSAQAVAALHVRAAHHNSMFSCTRLCVHENEGLENLGPSLGEHRGELLFGHVLTSIFDNLGICNRKDPSN